MSRRAKAVSAEAPGQDSFLDVVANLVGIFLILIIIVGSQAKSAVNAARSLQKAKGAAAPEPVTNPGDAELVSKLQQAQVEARETAREMESLQEKLRNNQFELGYRRTELEQTTLILKMAKDQLEGEKARLTREDQESIAAQVELKALEDKRAEIENDIQRAVNTKTNVEVVENLPSPKARKASVDEIEFRLKGGRLLHIPMKALQADVMKDMENSARQLRDRGEIERSVGPLRGFKIHYRIYMEEREVVAANGAQGVLRKAEADMRLEPVDDSAGEMVADALLGDSEMWRRLGESSPSTATVTLWVYPDSFGEFRKVRDALYKQGFLVAARPLPEWQPIACSTKGGRSVAQ